MKVIVWAECQTQWAKTARDKNPIQAWCRLALLVWQRCQSSRVLSFVLFCWAA